MIEPKKPKLEANTFLEWLEGEYGYDFVKEEMEEIKKVYYLFHPEEK